MEVAISSGRKAGIPLQSFQKIGTSSEQYGGKHGSNRTGAHWFATEKIHGAQLQLYICVTRTQCSICPAKRSGWIEPLESFFGFQEVVDRLSQQLLSAFQLVSDAHSDCVWVVLYGELFGGWYPSNAGEWRGATGSGRIDAKTGRVLGIGSTCADTQPVQEGVYYSPRKEFAVFDMAVVNSSHNAVLLPFSETLSICSRAGLFTVPVIAEAPSYEALLDLSLERDSMVPQALNAHDPNLQRVRVPERSNTAEGIVVRPDSSALDATYKGSAVRCLVKRKHRNFAEVEQIDYEAAAESPRALVARLYRACLTFNRLAAVRSKVGEAESATTIAEMLADDIRSDFWLIAPTEYQTAFGSMTEDDIAQLDSALLASCQQFCTRT